MFVNSMSDLFHDKISDKFIARVFAVMAATPRHTYQVLTKRHARMRSLLNNPEWRLDVFLRESVLDLQGPARPLPTWPLGNLWLGVSVETQQWADIRIPALMETPAAVRFLSCEPLLGEIDLTRWMLPWASLDWVITGGESGPGFRPADPAWFRSIRYQCAASKSATKPNGVAYLHKQNGGRWPKQNGRELDGQTWDEYPAAFGGAA